MKSRVRCCELPQQRSAVTGTVIFVAQVVVGALSVEATAFSELNSYYVKFMRHVDTIPGADVKQFYRLFIVSRELASTDCR